MLMPVFFDPEKQMIVLFQPVIIIPLEIESLTPWVQNLQISHPRFPRSPARPVYFQGTRSLGIRVLFFETVLVNFIYSRSVWCYTIYIALHTL
jgi:hypothetical protein